MSSAAKAVKKTHSASVAKTATKTGSFFKAADGAAFFGPGVRKTTSTPVVQTKLSVSKPADPLEREADHTAARVMRMTTDAMPLRKAKCEPQVQPFGGGTPTAAADALSDIKHASIGGQTLPPEIRTFMEPRLGADLGDVRVHNDETAHSLSNHLSARAFTYRDHIFFGRDQYQPGTESGKHLLAHELTHTLQQGATVRPKTAPNIPAVNTSADPPTVQRLGAQDVLDYFADRAGNIPGFRMLTLLIGFNPITMRSADRSAAEFLRALIELVPGGVVITRVLDNHGVINQAATWVQQKVAALGDMGAEIQRGLRHFINSLKWSDILDLSEVWDRARRLFTTPISRLASFGAGVAGSLLALVKQAILRPLAELAQNTRGYDLLRAVLGEDPITGEPVPRTAETLIGGFMKLIGQEEVWQNIKRGNAAPRAFAWFQRTLAGLMGFVRSVPQRIVQTITSLTFQDIISVSGAFTKVGSAFLGMAAQFGSWALGQVLGLMEILVSVVAPGVMPYIARAKTAFHTIIRDPVRFVGNLVRAGRLGFQKFAGNIGVHLKTALIKWLTGPLGEAGVYIPKSFSLTEILALVLSVLGLTWQNVRAKLAKIVPDPVLNGLEKTASALVTLASRGPAAAWEQIKSELTELKDQLVGQVTQMISSEIVKAAVTKLVTMLNPAGAVIQAVIATYNTVMFFVEKARQISAVVASFIESIAAIAAGRVEGAAARVEQTLADTLTVVIDFLARFVGLGGLPAKLVGIVNRIRRPIDRGMDKIVTWLAATLSKLLAAARAGAQRLLQWWKKKAPITGGDEPHTLTFTGERRSAELVVRSGEPEKPSAFLKAEHTRLLKENPHISELPVTLNDYMSKTQNYETEIDRLQGLLKAFDENLDNAASGERLLDANAESDKLDETLRLLATLIGEALACWLPDGEELMPDKDAMKIERAEFTVSQKARIAKEYLAQKARLTGTDSEYAKSEHLVDSKRGKINVAENIDRRHVVSSDDMAKHYVKALAKKRLSEAKILLEQRGSISEARQPVKGKLTHQAVLKAAITRYRRFFGYAKNFFLGDSSVNRSIQEHLDTGHPEMAGQALWDHVDRIKRAWALHSDFKPSQK